MDMKKFIIIIIIATLFVSFSVKTLKKAIIICKIEKGTEKYTNATNFYEKGKMSDNTTYELLRKDNIIIYKCYTGTSTKTIYKDISNNNIVILDDETENKKTIKTAKKTNNEQDAIIPVGTYAILGTHNFMECLKLAFLVKTDNCYINDRKCYKVNLSGGWELIYDKKDFLKIKEVIGDAEKEIIEYKENIVTNEDIKFPDLTEYNII